MTFTAVLGALGLLIAAEGLVYGAFPAQVKRAAAMLLALPEHRLRQIGLAAAASGVALVGLAALLR